MKCKTKDEAVFILNISVPNCLLYIIGQYVWIFFWKNNNKQVKEFLVARILVQNQVWTDMTDSWPTLETDGLRIASYSYTMCLMTS